MSISARVSLASRIRPGTGVISIRTVSNGLRAGFPSSVREIIGLVEPIKLTSQLNAATCSGSCEITISSDGLVHYTGKVHNSGALAASYSVITSFGPGFDLTPFRPAVAGQVVALGAVVIAHDGHAGGTFSFDTRNSTWDLTGEVPRIADNWAGAKAAATFAQTLFGTDTSAIDLIDGFASGATGIWVFGL